MAHQSYEPLDLDAFLKDNQMGRVPAEWRLLLSKQNDTSRVASSPTRDEMEVVSMCLNSFARLHAIKPSTTLVDRFEHMQEEIPHHKELFIKLAEKDRLMLEEAKVFDERMHYIENFIVPVGKKLAKLMIATDNIVGLTASVDAIENVSHEKVVEIFASAVELSQCVLTLDDADTKTVERLDNVVEFLSSSIEQLHVESRDSGKASDKVHFYVSPNGTLERADFSIGSSNVSAAAGKPDSSTTSTEDSELTSTSEEPPTGAELSLMTREQRRELIRVERAARRQAAIRSRISFKASVATLTAILMAKSCDLIINLFYGIVSASNNATVVAAVAGAGDLAVENSRDLDWKTWSVSWFTGWARKNYLVGEGIVCAVDNPIFGRFGCANFREIFGRFSYHVTIEVPLISKIRQTAEVNIAYQTANGASEVTRSLLDSEYFYWPTVFVLTIGAMYVVNTIIARGITERRRVQREQRGQIMPSLPSPVGMARKMTIGL